MILYIDVSYAESLRKNRRRFNPDRPDSILEHGLSDEKMERLYAETDWHEISAGRSQGRITIQGISMPFVVFENEDDVTTQGGDALGDRLGVRLEELWQIAREYLEIAALGYQNKNSLLLDGPPNLRERICHCE